MIHLASGVFALALLLPVADFGETTATPEINAYMSCMFAAAHRRDDQSSDAATIALAIRSVCITEFQTVKQQITAGMNPTARRRAIDQIDQSEQQVAIKAVLEARKGRPPVSN